MIDKILRAMNKQQ